MVKRSLQHGQFVDGVLKAWDALGYSYGYGEVLDLLPTVAKLDTEAASKIDQYIRAE